MAVQDQVNNLTNALAQDLAQLLVITKKLEADTDFYNSIGGSATLQQTPPTDGGINSNYATTPTANDLISAVANAESLVTTIATFRDSFTKLLSNVPR